MQGNIGDMVTFFRIETLQQFEEHTKNLIQSTLPRAFHRLNGSAMPATNKKNNTTERCCC